MLLSPAVIVPRRSDETLASICGDSKNLALHVLPHIFVSGDEQEVCSASPVLHAGPQIVLKICSCTHHTSLGDCIDIHT